MVRVCATYRCRGVYRRAYIDPFEIPARQCEYRDFIWMFPTAAVSVTVLACLFAERRRC